MVTLIAHCTKAIYIGTMAEEKLMLTANKGHIQEMTNTLKFAISR
jgi:hypothetical protein